MKTLGANSIRVYHVIADSDHDGCMSAFADAGIYAWIDLDTYDTYILPDGQEPRWTQRQSSAYQSVMDTFQKYDNVGGFFVGNEMLTHGNDSVAAPFIKAAARDMKSYRDQKGYRDIPIGYSAADIPDLRPNLQNYLACGSDSAANVDFYSLNVSSKTFHSEQSFAKHEFRPMNGVVTLRTWCLAIVSCRRMPATMTSRSSSLRLDVMTLCLAHSTINQRFSDHRWLGRGLGLSSTSGSRRLTTMAWSHMDLKLQRQLRKAMLLTASLDRELQ